MSAPSGTTCADCDMFVMPANAFHPGLYCWLFKRGIGDPEGFLAGYGFVKDPTVFTRDEAEVLTAAADQIADRLAQFTKGGSHVRSWWAVQRLRDMAEEATR